MGLWATRGGSSEPAEVFVFALPLDSPLTLPYTLAYSPLNSNEEQISMGALFTVGLRDRFRGLALVTAFVGSALACSLPGAEGIYQDPTATPMPPTSTPQPTSPPTAVPVDLETRPLTWFGPLPPLLVQETRPFIGAEDYMQLFEPDAPWQQTSDRVQVFTFFGEWIATDDWIEHASDDELEQAIADVNRREMAIAIDAGPLVPGDCGESIEGFGGGLPFALREIRRIERLGGTVRFLRMDEPFYFASLYEGPRACQWSTREVAEKVHDFIEGLRAERPDITVVSIEPFLQDVEVEDLIGWLDTYHQVSGEHFPMFHLDVDFSRPGWVEGVRQLEDYARSQGIEFGIFYLGFRSDPSDRIWLEQAGERVKAYELEAGGKPDHVIFMSWHDHPDWTLPETEPDTFTYFINQYFEDKSSLGVKMEGPGANLAYRKPVVASNEAPEFEAEKAVDGNTGTWWGSQGPAPQWIEIDLGAPATVAGVNLMVSQSPAGETVHRLMGAGPDRDFRELHTFRGRTEATDLLAYEPSEPWTEIQFVRLETVESPSWVSWQEIEVFAPE